MVQHGLVSVTPRSHMTWPLQTTHILGGELELARTVAFVLVCSLAGGFIFFLKSVRLRQVVFHFGTGTPGNRHVQPHTHVKRTNKRNNHTTKAYTTHHHNTVQHGTTLHHVPRRISRRRRATTQRTTPARRYTSVPPPQATPEHQRHRKPKTEPIDPDIPNPTTETAR